MISVMFWILCFSHLMTLVYSICKHKVLSKQGYDGAAADVWSCGVILYVLMAGYLPFEEADLLTLLRRINAAEFVCPFWFSAGARTLIHKILDPNLKTVRKAGGEKWKSMTKAISNSIFDT